MTKNDDDLRTRFAALREDDVESIPDFDSVRSRALRASPGITRSFFDMAWRPAFAFALVSASAALLWFSGAAEPPSDVQPWTAGQWAMPTDVLLDLTNIPGGDLLREIPDFGTLPTRAPEGAQTESTRRRIPV